MNNDAELKLLYKVVKAYYEDKLTYEQIGKRFDFSRMKVARLLSQAEEQNIVRVVITPHYDQNIEIERRLETRYNLDEVIVVSPSEYTRDSVIRALGPAAANCLVSKLSGKKILAITWGSTMLSVVNSLPVRHLPNLSIVETTGGLGEVWSDTYGADLVIRTAATFRGRPYLIPAPAIVGSSTAAKTLETNPQITSVIELASKADIAIIGMGLLGSNPYLLKSGMLSEKVLMELRELGAIGDIALRFIDSKGVPVVHEINNRIIGLEIDQLSKIPRVIGVAGGLEKLPLIKAVVEGKLIHTLVTDDKTAKRLLED
jgi:DNA-binding transcriptional regulator LsrR (DeoR family)